MEKKFAQADSFKAVLTPSGQEQRRIFKAFIQGRSEELRSGSVKYYAALMALCQSSGNGKSKLCYELLAELPGIMTVFREDVDAYPKKSIWSDDFIDLIVSTNNDQVVDIDAEIAASCNVGRCLIALLQLVEEYKRRIDTILSQNNIEDFLLQCRQDILANDFFRSKFDLDGYGTLKVGEAVLRLQRCLEEIKHLRPSPFVLVFDGAQVLLNRSTTSGSDAFSILRKAIHLLSHNTNLMVVVVGTSSTIVDFHPIVVQASIFHRDRSELIPPYILCENWDVLYDYEQLAEIPITPEFLLDKRTAQFEVSLGRPLWSSELLSEVINTSTSKLNTFPNSDEAKLVHVLLRASLNSAPDSQLAKELVKSYMASLIAVSKNTSSLKVHFCSEPVLAMASRCLTSSREERQKVFHTLLKAVQNNVVDRGRILESVFFYICLLAGDGCELSSDLNVSTNDLYPEYLKPIYQAQAFILENRTRTSLTRLDIPNLEDSLYKHYRVFTLSAYLKSLFRGINETQLSNYIPEAILESLLNFSHFLPTLKSFPIREVWGSRYVQLARVPDAWRRSSNRSLGLNFLSESLLKLGLQRQCAFIAPPDYYGVDGVIPAMLRDGSIFYLSIQIKMNFKDALVPICKMAAQCHFLACLRHGNIECRCEKRTSEQNIQLIKENQVSLMLCPAPVYERKPSTISTTLPHDHPLVSEWSLKLGIQPAEFKATKAVTDIGMVPALIVEKELSAGLRIVVLHWTELGAKHTCFLASRFRNFPVMDGLEEVALNIVRFYTDPFGDLETDDSLTGNERKRSYREIGNRVLKRSVGLYPEVDATIRARGGLPDLPPVPDYFPEAQ